MKAVRNFFTGITGSGLDRVIDDLKGDIGFSDVHKAMVKSSNPQDLDPELLRDAQQRQALDKWVGSNLRNYLMKQHGTEGDRLAGLVSNDPEGQPSQAIRTDNAADLYTRLTGNDPRNVVPHPDDKTAWLHKLATQDWPRYAQSRAYSNQYFNRVHAGEDPEAVEADLMKQYPASKADPVKLHDIDLNVWANNYQRPMEDTLDYLRTLRPEQLKSISVPDAVQQSKDWHAAMARKANEANLALIDKLPITKQYPNGAKWVEMGGLEGGRNWPEGTPEDDQMKAAMSIGKSLGHCYQNPTTCADYLSGSKLHTLIDPSGKPRVTVEVAPADQRYPAEFMKQHYPEDAAMKQIAQIRGPQNGEAPQDAVPYLKDFIASQPFTDVADAREYGLQKYTTQGGFPRWLDPQTLPQDYARYRIPADPNNIKGGAKLVNANDYADYAAQQQARSLMGQRWGGAGTPEAMRALQAPARAQALKNLPSPATYNIPDDFQPDYGVNVDPNTGVKYAGGGEVVHSSNGYDELKSAATQLRSRVRSDSEPGDPWWKHTPAHANPDAALNGTPHAEIPDALIDADHIGHVPDHPGVPYPTPGRRIAMAGGGLADAARGIYRAATGAKTEEDLYNEAVAHEALMRAKITRQKLDESRAKLQQNLTSFGTQPAKAAQTTDALIQNPPSETAQQSKELVHKTLDTQDAVAHLAGTYDTAISDTEDRYGIPHGLLRRLVAQESGFNPNAVSKAGAVGLMQFMPATAAEMNIDPTDPEQAIPAGGEYLRKLYDKFGSWKAALAGYNWGPGNVEKHGLGNLPPETQKYVKAILGFQPDGEPIASGAAGAIQQAKAMQAAVPRETPAIPKSVAKRLTGYATSDKVPSTEQDNKALLALLLSDDDDEDIDPLASLFDIEGVDGPEGANP